MNHPRILIQLDTDPQASVFDAVVALDSGVDHLLQYSEVTEANVTGLVHGAMFTRGPAQLSNTAIFVGGSNVADGEQLLAKISSTFFGPVRVSVMLDSNGANTTASAAVLCAARHLKLSDCEALVLGGTGPVGGRVARLLLGQGGRVHLCSRNIAKASQACDVILKQVKSEHLDRLPSQRLLPLGLEDPNLFSERLSSVSLVVACGAAGVTLLNHQQLSSASNIKVAIDLNAVPPGGIEGIEATDKAKQRGERVDYGAIGVGGLKMKIHRASIESLFERNDQLLDLAEIYSVGMRLEG